MGGVVPGAPTGLGLALASTAGTGQLHNLGASGWGAQRVASHERGAMISLS